MHFGKAFKTRRSFRGKVFHFIPKNDGIELFAQEYVSLSSASKHSWVTGTGLILY